MKYLSCPLCGTPEPELRSHFVDGNEVFVITCMSCYRTVRIEDITDTKEEE